MIWQLHCCLTSLCVYRQINSYQPPSGYLSITRSASGGSARDLRRQQAQGVPSPQKVASLRPRASGLLGKAQKLRVLFVGPSLHSSVRLRRTRHSGQKSRLCADQSGMPLRYNLACLCRSLPPRGKGVSPFPDLKYSAPAPCRSGSKGEAPWSPKAKSRIPYFRMPQPNSSGFLARPMPPIHSIQRMRPLPSFSLTRKEKRKRVPVLSGMPSFASGSDTS